MNLNSERRLGRTCSRQRGSLSVEAALLLPVLILVLVVGSVLADHQLAQQRLHRAVAAAADVLANQPLPAKLPLPERLAQDGDASVQLLANMLADPRNGTPPENFGVRIRYLDSALRSPDREATERIWSLGTLECTDGPSLTASLPRLVTPQNVGRSEFVAVEACFDYALPLALPQWAVPTRLESRFVTVRRHWRGS